MLRQLKGCVLLALLACAGVLAGCSSPSVTSVPPQTITPLTTPGPVISKPSAPSPPITVKMILEKVPSLNEAVELDLVINSIGDAGATTVSYDFPPNVVIESGSLDWKGDLKANEPLILQSKIKITQAGQITLKGKASSTQSNGDVWADAAYIYLTITKDGGMVGFPTETRPSTGMKQTETLPATNPTP